MNIIHAIILGIIEGITEFLPISSTGHLIITGKLLGIQKNEMTTAFEVIIQIAAILAVVSIYKDKFSLKHKNLWIKVGIAFLPIAIVGLLFHEQIKSLFTVTIVATMFILGGIMFFIVEYLYKKHPPTIKELDKISYKQAFFIGISQVFAAIPGTSRAGATITGGMLGKIDRTISAEFSFLLGVPVLGAASLFDIVKHYDQFNSANIIALLVGGAVAFIVAYITIKLFLQFLKNFTFISFGIYRIIIGILLLLFFRG